MTLVATRPVTDWDLDHAAKMLVERLKALPAVREQKRGSVGVFPACGSAADMHRPGGWEK